MYRSDPHRSDHGGLGLSPLDPKTTKIPGSPGPMRTRQTGDLPIYYFRLLDDREGFRARRPCVSGVALEDRGQGALAERNEVVDCYVSTIMF